MQTYRFSSGFTNQHKSDYGGANLSDVDDIIKRQNKVNDWLTITSRKKVRNQNKTFASDKK